MPTRSHRLSFSLSHTHTLAFFFYPTYPTRRSKKSSTAYARRPCAQRGSGTCTDSAGSSGEAGCCLLAARSQVGTVCTRSLCGYLRGDPKVWRSEWRLTLGQSHRQGLNMQRALFDKSATMFQIHMSAGFFSLYVRTTQVETNYTAMHRPSLSACVYTLAQLTLWVCISHRVLAW